MQRFLLVPLVGLILSFVLPALLCSEEPKSEKPPRLAILPREVPAPPNHLTTAQKVALGRQLFFDARLSGDNMMSCASCHLPSKAFGDGLPRGIGHQERRLSRNTPSLLNIGFYDRYFWDGRAESLEQQALMPIEAADEMNQNLDELEWELNAIPGYVEQFHAVFGTRVTREGIAQALAAFQRTLVTGPAPLDRFLAGDQSALSPGARRGMDLFLGEAGCVRCHHGPLLSDGKFYRLGVSFQDAGREAVSGKRDDRGKFRTPTLRNVASTAPYMHDGSLQTLEDVVQFYYRGVPTRAPSGLSLDVEPLTNQSFSEIPDLVEFLQALTGEPPVITPPSLP